jgi:ABC-2 type transport system ATP-binding protein
VTRAVIAVEGLTKRYGQARGVEDLTFHVAPGEVFGYLGPNGAGKTTTIRTVLDFIRPTSGRAAVFGIDSRRGSVEIHRRTGYLPGELRLYERMTAGDHLKYLAELRGGVDAREIAGLAERLDLDLSKKVGALSHGNRQKMGLVQALMHRPELAVLDEPTQGLDPLVQQEFYRLVEEIREQGRTVFLSSHVLPEVERVCDRVGIIREGRLVTVEHVADLKARAVRRVEIRFAESVPLGAFEAVAGLSDVRVHDSVVSCSVTGDMDALVKAAARFHVERMVAEEPSLEDIFLSYYGESPAETSPSEGDGS